MILRYLGEAGVHMHVRAHTRTWAHTHIRTSPHTHTHTKYTQKKKDAKHMHYNSEIVALGDESFR